MYYSWIWTIRPRVRSAQHVVLLLLRVVGLSVYVAHLTVNLCAYRDSATYVVLMYISSFFDKNDLNTQL